jgi:hypothetical protein
VSTSNSVPDGPSGVPATPDKAATPDADRATVTLATYSDYALAQKAIDFLSDNEFPVQWTSIVGTDLRLVERVTGRLTTARAAIAGAASGAWFGLFLGLLFGFFTTRGWFVVIVVAVLIGAIWGAIFGAAAHAMSGGTRDFSSRSTLTAAQYAVVVDAEYANQARQLLTRLNWQTSGAQ